MAAIPEPLNSTVAKIFAAYEATADDGHRPHLGASIIGHNCERNLWLTFRWAKKKRFPGRMLRLFQTGQLEEPRIVRDLRSIGVEVHATAPDGAQWRVADIGEHFGGSMDAAAVGVPEAPKAWHVVEMKTHNQKSFDDLVKRRVQAAKPQHYAQMQVYMGLTGMERALYVAVCKNTDDLYVERVEFDTVEFARLRARADRVINAEEPPMRVSNDPSWYECKMCHFSPICHGTELPEVNCRTCAHSTPELDGRARWSCADHEQDLEFNEQRTGCERHRYIPILLEKVGQQTDVFNGDVLYRDHDGQTFANGNGRAALTSVELHRLEHKSMAADACSMKAQLHLQGITTAEVVA